MDLKTLILTFKTDPGVKQAAANLRGFIARKFPDPVLLHQHNGEKLVYSYPWVQYKIINGLLMIIGISEGLESLSGIYSQIECIELGKDRYEIIEKKMEEKMVEFGITSSFYQYKFLTPWLALNQDNYQKYQQYKKWVEKKDLLQKIILPANVISMSKGLGYTVPAPIEANIIKIREVQTSLKGTPMLGFLGTFSVNFEIPDYWGIGKSVSRGFGTIRRMGS